ncbi:MAG: type II toxin-antitoxin system RelE/ParE family toxin [Gammaproteobacteria bacterium]|nr:type II toxin-antitoxin system RelE/ParE family toxin [Gammaproteobacteria bacterium]
MQYTLTRKAESDLEGIIDFGVSRWGVSQTLKYLDQLQKCIQMLAENSSIGIKRDTLSAGLFSFPYESHILYYIQASNGVTIIRILHGSMDAMKHM